MYIFNDLNADAVVRFVHFFLKCHSLGHGISAQEEDCPNLQELGKRPLAPARGERSSAVDCGTDTVFGPKLCVTRSPGN